MPIRIQRRRTKGWKAPAGAVSVTRPGPWGNPFTIAGAIESGYAKDESGARKLVVECFRSWLSGHTDWWQGPECDSRRAWMRKHLEQLRGKDLMCFCPPDQPCHAAVLIEFANR